MTQEIIWLGLFDADGSLFHDAYKEELKKYINEFKEKNQRYPSIYDLEQVIYRVFKLPSYLIFSANKLLIDYLETMQLKQRYDEIITRSGSLRQRFATDAYNADNKNTGFFILSLELFAMEFEKTIKKNTEISNTKFRFDPGLFSDLQHPHKTNGCMYKTIKAYADTYKNYYHTQSTSQMMSHHFGQITDLNKKYLMDESKLFFVLYPALLYSQEMPNKIIHTCLIDDNIPMLAKLHQFFQDDNFVNTNCLPANIVLHLLPYGHLNGEDKISLGTAYPPIQGTGPIIRSDVNVIEAFAEFLAEVTQVTERKFIIDAIHNWDTIRESYHNMLNKIAVKPVSLVEHHFLTNKQESSCTTNDSCTIIKEVQQERLSCG